jgi:hypothetical protein
MAVETAGFSTAAGSMTPVIIGNLEESMVQRSIAVERSDGRRIEVGLPAHQADPFWSGRTDKSQSPVAEPSHKRLISFYCQIEGREGEKRERENILH